MEITAFLNTHGKIGKMCCEYLKGSCEGGDESHCISCDYCCASVNCVPRSYSDESSCFHNLSVNDTPNTAWMKYQ